MRIKSAVPGFPCAALLVSPYSGLAVFTHTPSPMCFLIEILGQPANERPLMLIPAIKMKPLNEVLVRIE